MNSAPGSIPLFRPDLTEADATAVTAVLRSGDLAQQQAVVDFEQALAAAVNAGHAVAVCNGTAALHLLLLAAGLQPGDEVVTTPFTYISTLACIQQAGAVPVLADVEEDTLNLDPARVAASVTPRTRAILPVHVFGVPCRMEAILELASERRLAVIEDACEALGARYRGRPVGPLGLGGAFSFFANKQVAMGEGGAIVTNDDRVAELCRSLRHQGRPMPGEGDRYMRPGYNYKLSALQAALGASQLRRLPQVLQQRRRVAHWYTQRLREIEGLRLPQAPADCETSWFVYVVRLGQRFARGRRDQMRRRLAELGIETANYFPAVHLQPWVRRQFGFASGDFPVCEAAAERTLALPLFPSMKEEEVDRVARAVAADLEQAGADA